MERIKVTSKGQITLPKSIRDNLGIKTGIFLGATVKDGYIILKPLYEDNESLKLVQYFKAHDKGSIGIQKVRELAGKYEPPLTDYIRKARDEEADE